MIREFREDALRGIANTVDRINMHIGRLSVLRKKLELKPVESDLNQLVIETLKNLNGMPGVELVKDLHPLPKVVVDREQLQSVVTNLLLNALEAVELERADSRGNKPARGPRRALGRRQWLRDERGFFEGLSLSAISDHEEEGTWNRHVPIKDDRRSAPGKHSRWKASREKARSSGSFCRSRAAHVES